jgi:tetratricopeptide (TPR) repeat protein
VSERSRQPARDRRRLAFTLIACLIPVAFFAVLELALRIAGFGRDYPLFVPSPNEPAWLQANPEVVKRFFADPERAPAVSIETGYFLAEKPPGGLRIFVQGSSSAAGFPYGYGASLAGMLEQRLRRVLPGRSVEVVSTAMAAVNSYAFLDFADEILAQHPDAVLVYGGHNEYLGISGVGSALGSQSARWLTLLDLRLRDLRFYQLVQRAYVGLRGRSGGAAPPPPGSTLMAQVARERQIPLGSPLYARGLEQYRRNLTALLERYRAAGVPVFLGTLACNERDLEPFESALAPGTDAQSWNALFDAARAALDAGAPEEAARALEEAIARDDGAADSYFLRGRVLERLGDARGARAAYLAAKDRDQLRFRAPEDSNAIVRELAARGGVRLVDVQGALAAASEHGIIGRGLMLEHVHPNLEGYFLLADAYFDALRESGLLGETGAVPDDATARSEIPVSAVDRLFGEYKLQRILSDWPFSVPAKPLELPAPAGYAEELARQMYEQRVTWPQAMDRLQRHYLEQNDPAEHLRVALILADAFPYAARPQYTAGTALIRAGRAPEALRYLERAAQRAPDDVNALLALSHALILTRQYERALPRLRRVLELDPDNRTAAEALARLEGPR